MVNSQMSRTQLQAATRTKRWKILKAQTTHRAETATVVLEVPELELQVVISEKKVQDLVREVLMVAERRFCPFVSQRRRGAVDFTANAQTTVENLSRAPQNFHGISCHGEAFGKDIKSSTARCTNKQICIHVTSSARLATAPVTFFILLSASLEPFANTSTGLPLQTMFLPLSRTLSILSKAAALAAPPSHRVSPSQHYSIFFGPRIPFPLSTKLLQLLSMPSVPNCL
jgi:hypothetical protein